MLLIFRSMWMKNLTEFFIGNYNITGHMSRDVCPVFCMFLKAYGLKVFFDL